MNTAPSAVPFSKTIAPGLVARDVLVANVTTTSPVTYLSISSEGKYLAIGDGGGRVAIRDLDHLGKLIVVLNAGKDIAITCMAWLRGADLWSLFIASANGYLNCFAFKDSDFDTHRPSNNAVRVAGLITCLSINDDGSQIAASYDTSTKIFPLPLKGGYREPGDDGGFLINQDYGRFFGVPARNVPRAVSLHYVNKHTLCVAFFSSIKAYDTDPASRTRGVVWEIPVPSTTNIGSCALSPSRTYIVATNLQDGADWYSIKSKEYISKTLVQDTYDTDNYILPVHFLTDTTFIAGHNGGQFVTGTNGVERVRYHGMKGQKPLQHLAVSSSKDQFRVISATGNSVTATTFLLDAQAGAEVASAVVNPLIELSPAPERDALRPAPSTPQSPVPELEYGRNDALTQTRAPRPSTLPDFEASFASVHVHSVNSPPQTPNPVAPLRPFHYTGANFRPAGPVPALAQPRVSVALTDFPRSPLQLYGGNRGGDHEASGAEDYTSTGRMHETDFFTTPAGRSTGTSFLSREIITPPALREIGNPDAESTPVTVVNSMTLSPMTGRGALGSANRQREHLPAYPPITPSLGIVAPQTSETRRARFAPVTSNERQGEESNEEEGESSDVDSVAGGWDASSVNLKAALNGGMDLLKQIVVDMWNTATKNPKFASLVLLSVVVSVFALSYPMRRSTGVAVVSQFKDPSPGVEHRDDREESFDEDDEDEEEDSALGDTNTDGPFNTIVVTETKVLTVTRTVTATVTTTATATVTASHRPKRSPKSRQGRRP